MNIQINNATLQFRQPRSCNWNNTLVFMLISFFCLESLRIFFTHKILKQTHTQPVSSCCMYPLYYWCTNIVKLSFKTIIHLQENFLKKVNNTITEIWVILPGILRGRSQVPTNVPHGDSLHLLTPGNRWPFSLATICVNPTKALGLCKWKWVNKCLKLLSYCKNEHQIKICLHKRIE